MEEAVTSKSHVRRTHWDGTFCLHPNETGKEREEEGSQWSEIRCFLLITSSCDDCSQTKNGLFQWQGQRLTSTCPDPGLQILYTSLSLLSPSFVPPFQPFFLTWKAKSGDQMLFAKLDNKVCSQYVMALRLVNNDILFLWQEDKLLFCSRFLSSYISNKTKKTYASVAL